MEDDSIFTRGCIMRFLPHTDEEIKSMLQDVGAGDLEDLFSRVPPDCRRDGAMDLPAPITEWELNDQVGAIADMMHVQPDFKVLIGAGSYDHNIPAIVPALTSRSEFLTAYTPYQPEMAQGTLQGIFEYQTLTARLLGMDAANASIYDGASALAEALLMGIRISKKKKKVAISRAIHPHYRQVVATYFRPTEFEVVELPYLADGRTDLSGLTEVDELAAVAVQSPNFFGVIEDLSAAAEAAHSVQAIFITCFTEPLAYGLVRNPGSCGADIVCGEGQSFGIPRSFGGPGLGMFACLEKYIRSMPGRLVGQTTDLDGRRGYVLTLATREQHIRREKATSNICSNQGLCAMTAGIYMASLGGSGIRELSRLNYDKAEYFKKELMKAGAKIIFSAPTFNEFVVEFAKKFKPAADRLRKKKIIAGLELGRYYQELKDGYLFCITETASRDVMDTVVREVRR
jgi:glycine cleavage system P protein (glycine dehydrogenase) subunit 1